MNIMVYRVLKSSFVILILTIALSALQSVSAEVFKWKDKHGNIHFSDKPHANARQVDIPAPKPAGIGISQEQILRQKALINEFEKKRAKQQSRDLKAKKKQAKIDQYCKSLRRRLLNIQEADFLFTRTESGERVDLSDQRKQQEEQKLRAEIEKRC